VSVEYIVSEVTFALAKDFIEMEIAIDGRFAS